MTFLITASVLIVACGGQVLAKPPKGVCKTAEAPAGVGKWEGSPNTECTFPFTDEGKEYRGCTSNGNAGMYWCETVDGNWGNCRDDCPLHYDVPGCEVTGGNDEYAVSGLPCVFPFEWEGKTYQGCTEDEDSEGRPWCMTDNDELHWGYCNNQCPSNLEEVRP